MPTHQLFSQAPKSFGMVRGGPIDLSSRRNAGGAGNGDLAKLVIPAQDGQGMGGAMDLVAGVKRVVVVMEHSAKDGAKLLKRVQSAADRRKVVDMVVTDLASCASTSMATTAWPLIELADGVTLDEVKSKTEAEFRVAENA